MWDMTSYTIIKKQSVMKLYHTILSFPSVYLFVFLHKTLYIRKVSRYQLQTIVHEL